MKDTKSLIEQKAIELFHQYGIKSVSIDDLCHRLNISKKTFYTYYESKTALVQAMFMIAENKVREQITHLGEQGSTIEHLSHILEIVDHLEDVRKLPPLLYDLQKYYPDLLAAHLKSLFELNKIVLAQHLQAGISEGILRPDLDVEMCVLYLHRLYVTALTAYSKGEQPPQRELNFRLDLLLRGILTEKGKALLQASQSSAPAPVAEPVTPKESIN